MASAMSKSRKSESSTQLLKDVKQLLALLLNEIDPLYMGAGLELREDGHYYICFS
jgi:hypothetical protein